MRCHSRQRLIIASTWIYNIQLLDIVSKNFKLALSIDIPLDIDSANIDARHFIRIASSLSFLPALIFPPVDWAPTPIVWRPLQAIAVDKAPSHSHLTIPSLHPHPQMKTAPPQRPLKKTKTKTSARCSGSVHLTL